MIKLSKSAFLASVFLNFEKVIPLNSLCPRISLISNSLINTKYTKNTIKSNEWAFADNIKNSEKKVKELERKKIICEEKNWKIGVCDWLPIIHYGGGSIKDNSDKVNIANYNNNAYKEMVEYFENKNLLIKLHELRDKAQNYNFYK